MDRAEVRVGKEVDNAVSAKGSPRSAYFLSSCVALRGAADEAGALVFGSLLERFEGGTLPAVRLAANVLADLAAETLEAAGIERLRGREGRRSVGCTHGSLRMSRSVVFWYLRISLKATVPGR